MIFAPLSLSHFVWTPILMEYIDFFSISVLSRLFCLSKDPQVKIGPFFVALLNFKVLPFMVNQKMGNRL